MSSKEIEELIKVFSRLPGLGTRSAQRIVLHLLERQETCLLPLFQSLESVHTNIKICEECGNLDSTTPCNICTNTNRDKGVICIVQGVADLWAIERTRSFRGNYHILGGVLSALDGTTPDDLRIGSLTERLNSKNNVEEIIIALSATVDGQATTHYICDQLLDYKGKITKLARGVPVGGELDYLDSGTLITALDARSTVTN